MTAPLSWGARYSLGWRVLMVCAGLNALYFWVWKPFIEPPLLGMGTPGIWVLLALFLLVFPPLASFVYQLLFGPRRTVETDETQIR